MDYDNERELFEDETGADELDAPKKKSSLKVYHVGELTRAIKALLEGNLPSIWVEGEISDYTRHRSGHHYFTLKDSDSVISCVMWRGQAANLYFTPQPGMKALANGRVTVYEKGGRYQFEVWELQPAGEGELMAAFERMKAKLAAEGLFDPEYKKPIPRFPWKIGLITSPTGAAIRDLVSVSRRRNPAVELILAPVRVQGEGAAKEIAAAIEMFNRYREVDVLIVGRGGGSLEDLWPFNEEVVARAIFASELPVISAVGHEVDFSISDLTADLRAPTPSAAAELAVPDIEETVRMLKDANSRMEFALVGRIKNLKQRLEWARRSRGLNRPMEMVREYSQVTDEYRRRLETSIRTTVERGSGKLDALRGRLNALDPMAVLKRGYTIVRKLPEESIVTDGYKLSIGDNLSMTFAGGVSAVSKVVKIDKGRLPL